mmetsp:Transcript_37809/g.112878  ORF Transcript_37809/g.112878 Transcript_37809/m.112878 type:complete len:314 (+) Transcript_37809:247-1188(+)
MPVVRHGGPLALPGEDRLVVVSGADDEVEAHAPHVVLVRGLRVRVPVRAPVGRLLRHRCAPRDEVIPGGDGVFRRARLPGASVAGLGQRVALPVVVAHEPPQLGAAAYEARVAPEDLRPRVELVRVLQPEPSRHGVVAREVPHGREEGLVEAGPVADCQLGRQVGALHVPGQLLQNPERPAPQRPSGAEAVVVHDHPLVIDGAAVLPRKPLSPTLAVDRHPIGEHGPRPRKHRQGRAHVPARREDGIGGLLDDQAGGQHEEVVVGAQRAKVAGEGGLARGGAGEGQVVHLGHAEHGEEARPRVVGSPQLREVR